ncbi:MAG TPA: iron-sulfur cluster assembly protein [Geminicoccus sp.]|jgi:metal-sulfur cluster biosynthetic enzyme|uniref:iron-sulfur cluster assembly protein n=1 Tax=Geminicoccus sp. TaxID=2024832 RepID=UPI002E32165C|nr:iron-sulfur cluster assembly protein [Geminicoccus sp.]HEX2528155.1 iron-sulfur cluster assembly protein [Geminicoccus sp.]
MSPLELPVIDTAEKAEVMARLDEVFDPELDQSVTSMGFIESVRIEDRVVDVAFRLPTFWCSANFAFLMAVDMKIAIEQLDWVGEARIRLVDHFAARKINEGVARSARFDEVFAGEATTDLSEIRKLFREKAFLGRQASFLRAMVAERGVEAALALTLGGLRELAHGTGELRPLALRYLTARLVDGGPVTPDAPAFTTLAGDAVTVERYTQHLREIRRVRGAAEANAEMCRIYLEARYAGAQPGTGTTLEGKRHAHG